MPVAVRGAGEDAVGVPKGRHDAVEAGEVHRGGLRVGVRQQEASHAGGAGRGGWVGGLGRGFRRWVGAGPSKSPVGTAEVQDGQVVWGGGVGFRVEFDVATGDLERGLHIGSRLGNLCTLQDVPARSAFGVNLINSCMNP